MFSHTVKTNRYTTTIDIPAEKLYTRSKFIQIPKNSPQPQDQIIIVPNCCQNNGCSSVKNSSSSAQMRLMIQELEKAYNDDMQQKQRSLHEIEKLKNQQILSQNNLIVQLRDRANNFGNRCKQLQNSLSQTKKFTQSEVHRYKLQILERKNQSDQILQQNRRLKQQIQALSNQKNNLVKTKIKQFQSQKDKIWADRLNRLQTELRQKIKNQKTLQSNLFQLQQKYTKLMQSYTRLQQELKSTQEQCIKVEISLKSSNQEKNQYFNKMAQLQKLLGVKENQKNNLNSVLISKIQQNQQLLLELSKQREVLQKLSVGQVRFTNQKNNFNALEELHNEEASILAAKIVDLEAILHRKEDQLTLKQEKYILVSAQCIMLKQKIQTIQITIDKQRNKVTQLHSKINQLTLQNEKLHVQLSKKILQYNNLLQNPQQKVYSVKIQKTIDRKQYIEQLQVKLAQYEKIIDQLKQDNQSYIQEVKKRIMHQDSLKQKSKILQESIGELKDYISKKQNSLAWVVDRQIAKDVELSRQSSGISSNQNKNQSSGKRKTKGYKVFVHEQGVYKNEESIIQNLHLKGEGNDGSQILVMKPQHKSFNHSNVLE